MTPSRSPWIAALLSALAVVAFASLVRLPLPFPYATAVFSAVLAGLGTLALVLWMPARWVWSDAQLLTHAFQDRHGLTHTQTDNALRAITDAHGRATSLRNASAQFLPAVRDRVEQAADRLDVSAREIFYQPRRLQKLRPILVRSELIEEAVLAHSALRARGKASDVEPQLEASREKLVRGLNAMEDAFVASDVSVARGLLNKVDTASGTAELLLAPRRAIETLKSNEGS